MFEQNPLQPPTGVNALPPVARIEGAMFLPDKTPKESWATLQYSDDKGQLHQLNVPFLDAMYLLNLLKGMQAQSGFKMPDDPFAS